MPELRDQLAAAVADRYRLERELGRGGMAVVFLAQDLKHDRAVALKVLLPDLAHAVGSARFLQEIAIAAKLTHPNILPLHDSGEAAGLLYYVMPYVEGESLRDRLNREKQLPVADALQIAYEVADALSHAHSLGMIHRDIKPENILFASDHAVVSDFGIAKAVGEGTEQLTETGLAVGTPAYMSPEQAVGEKELDARSDLYSLACVLYEMLAGEPPFTGATAQAIIARKSMQTALPLQQIRDTITPATDLVIAKALARVPADRYGTARQLADALRAAQADVGPGKPAAAGVLSRTAIRLAIISAATAAVAVTGFFGWSSLRTGRPSVVVGNVRQLTRAPELELFPALSPDGDEVAYAGGYGANMHLFVQDISGGRPVALTAERSGTQFRPRWTSDGRSVVFQEMAERGAAEVSHVMPRFGGLSQRVGTATVWDVLGNRVAATRGDTLFVMTLDGEALEPITAAPFELHSVRWSPDGRALAYVVGNRIFQELPDLGNVAPSAIWIAAADGGEPVRVTDDQSLNMSPVWLPDARRILFVSDRDGIRDLYLQRLDRTGAPLGAPVRLTTGLKPHSLAISRDGGTVVYSQFTVRSNVWSVPLPRSGHVSLADARRVTVGNQIIENQSVSRDGRWLAFDSDLEGQPDIYVMPLDGGEPTRLTRDPAGDFVPDVSPDNREVAFYSNRHGTRDIFIVSTDGTGEARLSSEAGEAFAPRFSPDGLRIVYWVRGRGVFLIAREAVGAPWSAPRMVGDTADNPRWSADGTRLVYQLFRPVRLAEKTLDGDRRIVLDGPSHGFIELQFPQWSPDGALYFIGTRESGRRGLYVVPSPGASPRLVVDFDDPTKRVRGHFSLALGAAYFVVMEYESDLFVMDLELH